jgi:hypothetical protein
MTVAEMRDRVSQDEWVGWMIWHAKRAQAEELAAKRAG